MTKMRKYALWYYKIILYIEIKHDIHLERFIMNKYGMIKAVTSIRRCDKSYLW